ncbi:MULTISPECIES: DNA methyltransferase [Arthrobacter]|uniref:DNA methyltransferase n=2 Tax=Arthrobacter TaxID=1663 RepID=A0ABU9KL81_9MICC|nr:DNA methyltransferase [Arthrobacter sp. YJM1]MDP5226887.1 DNA methyltransferase [Arthrobacter sp. YJM1]
MSATGLEELYSSPLPAARTGALYNAFSYPTKISAESVALFIACHTEPGDHVLDVFGGSGTTGIAALLCERPTRRMVELAAERGLKPQWGARDATVYELSEIGTLLSRVMTHAPEPKAFAAAARRLVDAATKREPTLYDAEGPDGQAGAVRQIIWSDVVACPRCGTETTYADTRVRYGPLRFDDQFTCSCGHTGSPDDWKRVLEDVVDPWTGEAYTRRRRVPWKVYGKSATGNWSRAATEKDAAAEADALARDLPAGAPIVPLRWGDLHRSGYHQGMSHLHHLYTARNFRALATLWQLIEEESEELREALRLLVLSYNAAHSTLMTRVVLKKNSKDFVVTGAQSGVMYVSGLPVEKNVFTGVQRKIKTFAAAFEVLHGLSGEATIVTGSSADLHLGDESIDYVFTDPPFGGYIPYSEINQLNELWLGKTTRIEDEAIISPAQGKGVGEYQALLTSVFSEVGRVMKPSAEATIVFHSSQASVWQALASSLADAGLVVTAASILDKTQASFKQVNGHVAVSGDPLLRVKKRALQLSPPVAATMRDLALAEPRPSGRLPMTPRQEQHRYSELVGAALVGGVPITMDARAVYRMRGAG